MPKCTMPLASVRHASCLRRGCRNLNLASVRAIHVVTHGPHPPCLSRGTDLTLAERKADLHSQLQPFGCQNLIVVEALAFDLTG